MTESRYRQLVRASGIYDVLATAAFATPWTYPLLFQLFNRIAPMPAFEPTHALFVNLLGSVVLVWSALRIWRPDPVFGLFDAYARALFFCWQMYYLLVHHVTPVVWAFAAIELLLGVLQAVGYWRLVGRSTAPAAEKRAPAVLPDPA
ncbi:hypothetical protein dqs_2499 [Azoarcus olearius]|uniref:hypothetical protein n=1 Tax=Azoarcus sp. (strain BH72) TaxID=418699 RepID=UPI0008063850|nr:hypothetical protein [Azoarcus olearius]ANQ85529.1 hypothetical protein dqs_2499 [Azoarcus olearius]